MITDTVLLKNDGFESIHHFKDAQLGLEGILAFTGLRPSIGGIRYLPGTSFDEALDEVCGLASAMSMKAFAAGLNADGVKMFVFRGEKTPAMLHAIGDFVESLQGRYIASIDIGTTPEDIAIVGERTQYVSTGDPSLSTAKGVASAIYAYANMENIPLADLRVFITGVCGAVGSRLAMLLRNRNVGAIYGKDITTDPEKIAYVESLGVELLRGDEFPFVHIYSPCARRSILNETTIPLLKQAGIQGVIGSANCQLKNVEQDALRLHEAGILYAPDYVVNRGGLIYVGEQFGLLKDFESELWQTGEIVSKLFKLSRELNQPTTLVAREYFKKKEEAAAI
ncbi:MAG: amino acid dehydrogenase [Parcubacteria group bacterium]|nr:amino acid dehydrogenase [Parcubacteria group bacterium]